MANRSSPWDLGTFIRQHIRSVVYGGTDGIITTFAVVSSVNGASLSLGVLLLMGVATVFADALSMSVSDFMSTMAEVEMRKTKASEAEKALEAAESDMRPRLEQLFASRGYEKREVDMLVPLVLRDKQLAGTILDEMEDPEENTNTAVASAVATFVAFVFFGLIPLISIICLPLFGSEFVTSCFWTGITLMLLGYFKARVTKQKTHVSSLVMLCLGGGVSLLAYGIARCMAPFVDLGNATVSETIAAK